ncbi:MAG TPA: aquaporin [Acidimicrobiia bacterium]
MSHSTRIAVAEAIGTLILVVGGPGTAILATGGFFGPGSVGVLGVALAFGLAMLTAFYAVNAISGCHINPAVTAGLWITGKVQAQQIPWYLGGQFVGGVIGAGIIWVIAHSHAHFSAKGSGFASNGYGSHSPGGFKLPAVILTEIVFSALFVFVVASTCRKSLAPGFNGLTIGLMLTLVHLVTIPIDNTSVNPARSLATAIFQHGWALKQVWVFLIFPTVGGILGGVLWNFLVQPEDK